MKIILLQNVENLGQAGEIKKVADGFARNFLIPRGLARLATQAAIVEAKVRARRLEEEVKEKEALAKKLAQKLKGLTISLKAKASTEDKLFGSIGAKEIVEALQAQKLEVTAEQVKPKAPIKKIGEYPVSIDLGYGQKAVIKLEVKPLRSKASK